MKAIRVTVDFSEWSKVGDFISGVNYDDTFVYQVDNTTMVIVTEGKLSMAYIRAKLTSTFKEEILETILK